MELHFVDTANVCVYYPYLKKARSALAHFDAVAFESLICKCWAKVEWGHCRILVRDGANAGWVSYMLKDGQKSEFDGFLDCVIIETLHNPIVDA